jgi:hypothetical protein
MANKDFGRPVRSNVGETVRYVGNFGTNGGSSPTAAQTFAPGCTVARTATATYTVTIPHLFANTCDVRAEITMGAASVNRAEVTTVAQSSGTTVITIIIVTTATGAALGADVGSGSNNRVYFDFTFTNSAIVT